MLSNKKQESKKVKKSERMKRVRINIPFFSQVNMVDVDKARLFFERIAPPKMKGVFTATKPEDSKE